MDDGATPEFNFAKGRQGEMGSWRPVSLRQFIVYAGPRGDPRVRFRRRLTVGNGIPAPRFPQSAYGLSYQHVRYRVATNSFWPDGSKVGHPLRQRMYRVVHKKTAQRG